MPLTNILHLFLQITKDTEKYTANPTDTAKLATQVPQVPVVKKESVVHLDQQVLSAQLAQQDPQADKVPEANEVFQDPKAQLDP